MCFFFWEPVASQRRAIMATLQPEILAAMEAMRKAPADREVQDKSMGKIKDLTEKYQHEPSLAARGLRVAAGGGTAAASEGLWCAARPCPGLPTAAPGVARSRVRGGAAGSRRLGDQLSRRRRRRLALLRRASGPTAGGAAVEDRGRWREDAAGLRWLRGLPRGPLRAAAPQGEARMDAEAGEICCSAFWRW